MTTDETVTVTDPHGAEHEVTLRCKWSEFQVNPCDKEPAQYQGEDDGHELNDVTVTQFN